MSHPTDEALAQMASGSLHGAELEALEHHLDGCGSCRTLLAAVSNGSAPYSPPERALLKSGEKLGRYEIEALIAAGGMGMLYAAKDPQLNRRVVLKLMRPAFGGELGRVRLLREAQAMASLSHPNVVSVYELGESGERVFVAMELVEGGTLREWMKAPGTWKDVLSMMVQAGQGLAAAHRAGVVHRDFKPENVLVGKDGRPRVGDFGLARPELVAEEEPPRNLPMKVTHTGTMLGTPAYMSPEQLAGKPADARSDQYSFCVTLYEALTGKRPFPSESLDQLRAHVAGGMPPPPKDGPVPAQVWAALAKGLQPNPAHRFPDMESLLELLGSAEPARLAAPGRGRALVASVAAALTLLLAGGATVAWRLWPARAQPAADALATDLPETLDLVVGASRDLPLTGITRIAVGDEDIAKVSLTEGGFRVWGKRHGRTTLLVWQGTGRQSTMLSVRDPLPDDGQLIELDVAMQKALDVAGVERVAVGDPSIADVKVVGDDQVLVIGAGDGETTLRVWTASARRSWTVRVKGTQAPQPQPQPPTPTPGPGPAPGPTPLPSDITLDPGTERTYAIRGITRLAIGDTNVATVATVRDVLQLFGREPGETTLTVWVGAKRYESAVTVKAPPPPAAEEVSVPPGAEIVLDVAGVHGVLVDDPAVAEAKTVGHEQVVLTGKKTGRASLLALTTKGPRGWLINVKPKGAAPIPGLPPAMIDVAPAGQAAWHVSGVRRVAVMNVAVASADYTAGRLSVTGLQSGVTQLLVWVGGDVYKSAIRVTAPREVLLVPTAKEMLDVPALGGIDDVMVGEPSIASATRFDLRHVEINAQRPGRTTLIVRRGDKRETFQLTVLPDSPAIAAAVQMLPEETWEVSVPGITRCFSENPGVAKVTCSGADLLRIDSLSVGYSAIRVTTRDGALPPFDVRVQFF